MRRDSEKSFADLVYAQLVRIPRGRVATYGDIARAIQRPGAARAVGNTCGSNPRAPAVPCHRVVAKDGSIGGYSGGISKKIGLLEKEGVIVQKNRIVDFERLRVRWGH